MFADVMYIQSMHKKQAFSLVELSIVLVILGLLVGGILAGQSLIRAAELRAVGSEYQRYMTAVNSFRDKYFGLPGDITNATAIWGTAGTCPGTSASPSTTAATCNGNGDGIMSPNIATSNELYRFWQQLANAGLIEGTYSGVANSTTAGDNYALIGTNVPRSKLSIAGWSITNIGTVTLASASFFEGNYGGVLYFGAGNAAANTNMPAMLPNEAWNIDTKLDDGRPGLGRVLTAEANTACHDAGTSTSVALAATANYALSTTTIACPLIFETGY